MQDSVIRNLHLVGETIQLPRHQGFKKLFKILYLAKQGTNKKEVTMSTDMGRLSIQSKQ